MNDFKIQDLTPKSPKSWIIGVVITVLILLGDEALGRIYFYSLCASNGGEKIYKTVELPQEYWRENGEPVFLDEKGVNKVKSILNDDYAFHTKQIKNIRLDPQIIGYEKAIKDKQSGEILATKTTYYYGGGWLINSQPFHVQRKACPVGESGNYAHFLKNIFLNQKNNLSTEEAS
tara:strand:- start:581 stop:1105 length:525 start_codon:yes stop_codon:yes gene_type:complete